MSASNVATLHTRNTIAGAAAPGASSVILTRGTDVRLEPIHWLWKGWLARGKLHLLAGMPGQGKTTLTLAFAAAVTTGGRWPDGTRCATGNVLIYSNEDDLSDTLAPRLTAAGADMSRVFFVTGTRAAGGEAQPFEPARDMPLLQAVAAQIEGGIDLLIVDPVVSVLTGDSHKNAETRRALQPLVDLAASAKCALVGITHLSKGGQGGDPTLRVLGSIAFTALARLVMLAAKSTSDEGDATRVLVRSKSNIGRDGGGFEYRMEQQQVAADICVTRIDWGKALEGTAGELLEDPDADDGAAELPRMIRDELADGGWYPAAAVSATLRAAGYTPKQIRSARKKAGVLVQKGGYEKGWYWKLAGAPGDSHPPEGALS
ncbi:MAG: AAA family ATPase [Burkholderiaceae bacterium]|nr:MAG: AAA family ATPase [Burkholderiaceae bacterium]